MFTGLSIKLVTADGRGALLQVFGFQEIFLVSPDYISYIFQIWNFVFLQTLLQFQTIKGIRYSPTTTKGIELDHTLYTPITNYNKYNSLLYFQPLCKALQWF